MIFSEEIVELKYYIPVKKNAPEIMDSILIQLLKDQNSLRDIDLANYFLTWFDNSVFYNVDEKQYYFYNGKYYKADSEALLLRQKLNEFVTKLVSYANNKNVKSAIMNKIYNFKDNKKIDAVVKNVKILKRKDTKQLNVSEYDYLFNVQNGIIDLSGEEAKLVEHTPNKLITQIADIEFKPELGEVDGEAKELLLSFFLGDVDVLNFMLEFLGTALTGDAAIRKFVFAFGSGKNGKSTLFNFFLNYFFGNYATSANYQILTKDRNNSNATSDLVGILSKRLVVTNEVEEKNELNANLIKSITGGDPVGARLNYQDEQMHIPKCKIIMFGNNQLNINDGSSGMQDRYSQVPFMAKFDNKNCNRKDQKEVWDILKNNKPQILNSFISGFYRYKKRGKFAESESIENESLCGFASSNNFVRFVNNYLIKDETSQEKVKDVFVVYKSFADEEELNKGARLNRTGFVNALKSNDIKLTINNKGTAIIKGYKLINQSAS